jgi:hypothetical protein
MLLAAGVLLAACSGGSSKSAVQPSTTTKPPVVPNTPKQRAADKAIATKAVLALTDFPIGYTSTPHKNSGDDLSPAVEKKFLACTHIPKRLLDNSKSNQPHADSPDFMKGVVGAGPAIEVESNVEIDRALKDVSEPLTYLAAPNTVNCFQPFFKAAFESGLKGEPGVSLSNFTFRGLSVGPIGDQAAGFQGRVTLVGPRASLPLEFNLYFVRVGRSVVTLTATTFSIPMDQPYAQTLLEKMVGRLKAAPGLAAS